AIAEHLYPFLRGTELDVIADIEMPADPGTINRIEVLFGLLGFHDEIVPDVFDGDFYAGFLAERQSLANSGDGTLAALLEGHVLVHHTGNEQNGTRAVAFGVANSLLERFQSLLADFFVRVRQRFAPVMASANARGFQSGFLERVDHFVLIHVAV